MLNTIYVTHATSYDYKNLLYLPLKSADIFNQAKLILPHEHQDEPICSKDIIQKADLILAEVSYPSIGQGIELGWAECFQKPLICFYQHGKKYSESIKLITDKIFSYENSDDLVEKLKLVI